MKTILLNKSKYFVRTEETIRDAEESLKRGCSVWGWNLIGENPWKHLYGQPMLTVKNVYKELFDRDIIINDLCYEDYEYAFKVMGLQTGFEIEKYFNEEEWIEKISENVIYRVTHPIYEDILMNSFFNPKFKNKELIKKLNLQSVKSGGYIKYLDGLCALEKFSDIPDISNVNKMLIDSTGEQYLFKYLVCFEGEEIGKDYSDDWKEEWPLFKPKRIVWIKESGFNGERLIE